MTDEIKITITLKRNVNGTVTHQHFLEGEGFHLFEIIGLLEMVKDTLVSNSKMIAQELPDQPSRIKFEKERRPLKVGDYVEVKPTGVRCGQTARILSIVDSIYTVVFDDDVYGTYRIEDLIERINFYPEA